MLHVSAVRARARPPPPPPPLLRGAQATASSGPPPSRPEKPGHRTFCIAFAPRPRPRPRPRRRCPYRALPDFSPLELSERRRVCGAPRWAELPLLPLCRCPKEYGLMSKKRGFSSCVSLCGFFLSDGQDLRISGKLEPRPGPPMRLRVGGTTSHAGKNRCLLESTFRCLQCAHIHIVHLMQFRYSHSLIDATGRSDEAPCHATGIEQLNGRTN